MGLRLGGRNDAGIVVWCSILDAPFRQRMNSNSIPSIILSAPVILCATRTPIVAKYERESVAKWGFGYCAVVNAFLGVMAIIMFMMGIHKV